MNVIATDLDRTLFPNGKQPYDESMPLFANVLSQHELPLIYVTGRNLQQIQAGIREYEPPLPLYAIAEVGTRVYRYENGTFVEDHDYVTRIHQKTPNWNIPEFRRSLASLPNLRLQEPFNQNAFKLSYYVDRLNLAAETVSEVTDRTQAICPDTNIIYSVDETIQQGLLDVLPRHANKIEGLEYVREKLGAAHQSVIYCGDSGNDILPLTFGYRAVVVRNAIEQVRKEVRQRAEERGFLDRVYFAQGRGQLNGHYVSGVLEGLMHFGVIEPSTLETT